jgi:hypothetical protein
MAKNYTWLLVGLVVVALAILYYTRSEGFQDAPSSSSAGTDPALIEIFANLNAAYALAAAQIANMGVQSTPVQITTLDKYIEEQMMALQALGQKCSTVTCTEVEIKDPELLTAYTTANTLGALGLPAITFDTLAEGPPVLAASEDTVQPSATQAPVTQLPAAQMPASVLAQPSLEECKKYYSCSISTNMV